MLLLESWFGDIGLLLLKYVFECFQGWQAEHDDLNRTINLDELYNNFNMTIHIRFMKRCVRFLPKKQNIKWFVLNFFHKTLLNKIRGKWIYTRSIIQENDGKNSPKQHNFIHIIIAHMINNCWIVQNCYLILYLNLWIIKQTISYERPIDCTMLKENFLI